MNSMPLVGVTLFSRKNEDVVFNKIKRHGIAAWIKVDGEWKELSFWDKKGFESEWVTVEEYRRRNKEIKERNIKYYREHLVELTEKIDLKKKEKKSKIKDQIGDIPVHLCGGWEAAGY